jgi:alkyl hydroperoxide reductase subunit D
MDIDQVFEKFESTVQRDLKLNFKKFYFDSGLSAKEAALITLACAESVSCPQLIDFTSSHLKEIGSSEEEIQEAKDCAAIMGLMNMYYRFRHYIGKEAYQKPAGLRMNVMARPVTGKQHFESMALAVSILNGCENCIKSHEKSLIELGMSEDQIHDLARLASTVKALEVSFRQLGTSAAAKAA